MKILVHSILILCAAGIGLSVGLALRKKPAAGGAEISVATTSPSADSRKNLPRGFNQRARVRPQDDSPLATQLARDLSMSRGVTRWLCWMEAIDKAHLADFPRLIRLAQGDANAFRLVAERWVELDPRHMFDTLVAASKGGAWLPTDRLAKVLFEEWTKRDPDALIAALNTLEEFGPRRNWRIDVATYVTRQDAERGLRLLSDWHIENYGPSMKAITQWAAANPRHAAEFALAHPAGYATELTMETIGKEWAKMDPGSALAFAAGRPGAGGDHLGAAALKEWAGRNLREAADWLAGADARTRNRLSPAFVEVWAKQDAVSALAWCEVNLSGSGLAPAVGGVMKGLAAKDVAAAARLVIELNPSPARSAAAVTVADKWLPSELSSDQSASPKALAWLSSLDAESVRRIVDKVDWSWATSDPKSMADFLASNAGSQISNSAFHILAQQLARKDPLEALDWANRLPANRSLPVGADAFAEWNISQPDIAMKWLRDLSATDPRRQPFLQEAIRSMAYQPQAVERLTALPAAERAVARTVIEGLKLPEEGRKSLLEALKAR